MTDRLVSTPPGQEILRKAPNVDGYGVVAMLVTMRCGVTSARRQIGYYQQRGVHQVHLFDAQRGRFDQSLRRQVLLREPLI